MTDTDTSNLNSTESAPGWICFDCPTGKYLTTNGVWVDSLSRTGEMCTTFDSREEIDELLTKLRAEKK